MGRALAAFVIGVVIVLAAIGFAMYYGLFPRGVQILSIGDSSGSGSSDTASGSSSSAASGSLYTTSTSNSSAGGVVGAAVSYVSDEIAQYVAWSRQLVGAFFEWLLGSSLYDAVLNLVVVVIVAGVLYWVLRFLKWIIMVVVAVDALLIVLRYVLMVI
jgi:hypothetical protein